MYTDEYWDRMMGTNTARSILVYLLLKQQAEISVQEFLTAFGAPDLENASLRHADPPLCFRDTAGTEWKLDHALELPVAVSALLVESMAGGGFDLFDLSSVLFQNLEYLVEYVSTGSDLELNPVDNILITATEEEYRQLHQALQDFLEKPDAYDVVDDYLVPLPKGHTIDESFGNVVSLYGDLCRELEEQWTRHGR